MRKEFVMRGQTASDNTEVLNFGKYKAGYAYRMTEFLIWPSTSIGDVHNELAATVTAAKTAENPLNPNFNNEGLIAVAMMQTRQGVNYGPITVPSIVNDTYIITQNLILKVVDNYAGSPMPVNWQCRFKSVKMTGSEEAAVNYKQFAISDE
jgi:hypothetical protein